MRKTQPWHGYSPLAKVFVKAHEICHLALPSEIVHQDD